MIRFLKNLNARLENLRSRCTADFNINILVGFVLINTKKLLFNFNSFCLWIPIVNDDMTKQLHVMIKLEHLIQDYKITRTTDRIYLIWELMQLLMNLFDFDFSVSFVE